MMDDNLSDVQQEKKMSVKELMLIDGSKQLKIESLGKEIEIIFGNNEKWVVLDRNQAHMLMLYLQQHLGYVSISKDRLDE
jgi:hypothetical protein